MNDNVFYNIFLFIFQTIFFTKINSNYINIFVRIDKMLYYNINYFIYNLYY